ncbi:MAG: PQQ-binding-like beta-propeller repeat protein [Opitutales bacterium]|nr:PQQ-binding-like beta-propeller repeat protein [Opitutales bacterium]
MKQSFRICLAWSVVLVGLNAFVTGSVDDWPKFRGHTEQGISTAKNVPTFWSTEKNIVWKKEIPHRGWSSPLLIDGKIILTTAKEELVDGMHDLKVLQVDAETGEILWIKTVLKATKEEGEDRHPKNSLASPTPAIEDGVIYAHFGHMGTVALDFDTGETLWKQKISYTAKNGAGGTPIIVDDKLVFTTDSVEEPVVTALYKKTGEIAWRTTPSHQVQNNFSHGTPLLIDNRGRKEIISPGSGMVGAYRPEDGKEIWKVRYRMGFSMSPRPIFVDDVIYMSTSFSRASFLASKVDGATGDLTDTHVLWANHKSMPKTPSTNFVHGNIITLEDDGRLQSLSSETGERQWMEPLKGKFYASPVQVGNLLYIVSEEGLCYVLRVRDDDCEIISEIPMEEETLATPAIVDNTIYLRTRHHLWKIQEG